MKRNSLSGLSRALLFLCGGLLVTSIFVPMWAIYLEAPQYPEGLAMTIHATGVKGDVEIINGLNHYIGMKTIHNEDFIEFKILPYLIGFFALFAWVVALTRNKMLLNGLLILFIAFGCLAMYDFWKWEYDYGHNLDPNAAIIVPGMAYQPPLIGFKQLLNFGAYSYPAAGGWLFIACGAILLFAVVWEYRSKNIVATGMHFILLLIGLNFSACINIEPETIKLNKDHCEFCKMRISNPHFGAELKTRKGRAYKFDDITCMFGYLDENSEIQSSAFFVHDYLGKNELIAADQAYYLKGGNLTSPMGGNIAAFRSKEEALSVKDQMLANEMTWEELKP